MTVADKKSEADDTSDDKTDSHKNRSLRPPGWNTTAIETRFADVSPQSYDKAARTVDAVLSMGSPVKRFYGTEVLRIDPTAVILSRVTSGGIPLLDSHNQFGIDNSLGRVQKTWFKRNALMGKLSFNDTEEGRKAEGMVARGEIAGISAGYKVEEWEITDSEGRIIDPEIDRVRWDDDLTFTATRWELLEASLVTVPADAAAGIRSVGSGCDRAIPNIDELRSGAIKITKRIGAASITYEYPTIGQNKTALNDVRARMQSRQAMQDRLLAAHFDR